MTLQTLADITTTGTVQLTNSRIQARFVQLSATGGPARVGDSNVGSARGLNIPQNGTVSFELDGGDVTENFSLNQIYVYVPTGTTVQVTYGVG